MPTKSTRSRPKYTLHRGTGQARVRINGKDHYLGEHGSSESRDRYEELMRLWFDQQGDVSLRHFTIDDLAILFLQFAEGYYVKNGEQTSEVNNMRIALRPLVGLLGQVRISEFRPADMKRVRDKLIKDQIARTSINRQLGRIKRVFRWGVEEGYVPASVLAGVTAISGLRAGRSGAVESAPVRPVSIAAVEAVEPFVSRQVWGMSQLQLATGMRPGEVTQMRGCDLNMSVQPWEYTPTSHKTEHRGKRRVISIGPRGQQIIRQFLKTDLSAYLFSPADAREEFDSRRKANRKTPMTPSQALRTRSTKPIRAPGDRYTVFSYGQAIRKACELAFGMPDELRSIPNDLFMLKTSEINRIADRMEEIHQKWKRESWKQSHGNDEVILACLGAMLVDDPELNTFEVTKDLWACDWAGVWSNKLPDGSTWTYTDWMYGTKQSINPAIVHCMRGKDAMRRGSNIDSVRSTVGRAEPVGTKLAEVIGECGIVQQEGCSCKNMQKQMDNWGIAGCKQNRPTIINHLAQATEKASWLDMAKAVGKGYLTVGMMLDEALKRAANVA